MNEEIFILFSFVKKIVFLSHPVSTPESVREKDFWECSRQSGMTSTPSRFYRQSQVINRLGNGSDFFE
jgi:hypothetical protein